MSAEEVRGVNNEIGRFPIGMRVLAVDGNPTCLKLLDGLLKNCQYHVTSTTEAIRALQMLRENRNRFDLVISNVHMPDMESFKLLELVRLEMDLPIIMLLANNDPKLVMKGITHGACDYLVKPVRLEELRNVWQHVIRKKVKSQVVWSIDLHRKFVAAVNQLGIEKADPKRIFDLMNVEGLTRENVASHLQKYRLYLRRISQQANTVVAFGGSKDASSYMRTLGGFSDFRSFSGSGRLPNAALSSYAPSGMLSRLNSATDMTLHSLASPSMTQPTHTQNLTNSIAPINKFQPVVLPTPQNHQSTNLFQGIPTSFDPGRLQQLNKPSSQLSDFNTIDESRIFNGSNTFLSLGGQSSLNLASSSQQANMVVAFGGSKDASSYMRTLDGFSDFCSFSGSGRLPNAALSSYAPSGMLSRLKSLNSATGMTLHSLASPSMMQPTHTQNLTNSIAPINKFQPVVLPTPQNHQSTNLFQGIPTSFDPGRLQQLNKPSSQLSDFNTIDESRIFNGSNTFLSLGGQSSLNLASSSSTFLDVLPPVGNNFHDQLPPDISLKYCFTAASNTFNGFGSNITSTASIPLEGQGQSERHGQYGKQMYSQYSGNAFSTLAAAAPPSNVVGFGGPVSKSNDQVCGAYNIPNGNNALHMQWNRETGRSGTEHKLGQIGQGEGYLLDLNKLRSGYLGQMYSQYSDNAFSTLASAAPPSNVVGLGGPVSESNDQICGVYNRPDGNNASHMQQNRETGRSFTELKMGQIGQGEGYLLDQNKLPSGYVASNGYGSLDDLMNGMIKRGSDCPFIGCVDPPMCQRAVSMIPGLLRGGNNLEHKLRQVEQDRAWIRKLLYISWMGFALLVWFTKFS